MKKNNNKILRISYNTVIKWIDPIINKLNDKMIEKYRKDNDLREWGLSISTKLELINILIIKINETNLEIVKVFRNNKTNVDNCLENGYAYEINNIDPFISKQFNGNNMVFKCFSSFIFIWILINMVLLCTTILSNVSKSDLCIVNKRNWTNIWPYENSHESSKPYYYGITITNIVLPFLILFISILKCDLLKIKKYRKITDNILLLSHTFVLLWLSWLFSQTIYQIMNNMGCFLEIIIGISISLITLITFSTLFFRIINYQ